MLLAVHISDGVLVWTWLLLGFAIAGGLIAWSAHGISDEDIPRVGLLTAAFFVASLIHVRVGPTSVHLLLNGLVGVLLGRRAVLAVAIGLLLQAFLLGHGGFSTLGVNCCIIAVPALFCRPYFRWLAERASSRSFRFRDGALAAAYIVHPLFMLPFAVAVYIAIQSRRRWNINAYFKAGFLVGMVCVLTTAALNAVLLLIAGVEDWSVIAVVVLAAHIPIALIEAAVVGSTARFLQRVKPELLGGDAESIG